MSETRLELLGQIAADECIHDDEDAECVRWAYDTIERLTAWRAEAIEVLTNWDLVAEMIDTRPQDLGRSKPDLMADYIQRLTADLIEATNEIGRLRAALNNEPSRSFLRQRPGRDYRKDGTMWLIRMGGLDDWNVCRWLWPDAGTDAMLDEIQRLRAERDWYRNELRKYVEDVAGPNADAAMDALDTLMEQALRDE